jgi:uncharacterized repeat protein (TIGR04138 family)
VATPNGLHVSGWTFFCTGEEQYPVTELAFREGIMDQIRLREQRFDERAYLFVLSSLEHCQGKLTERRHITGPELAHACRELALHRFGVMARLVLEHWGCSSVSRRIRAMTSSVCSTSLTRSSGPIPGARPTSDAQRLMRCA